MIRQTNLILGVLDDMQLLAECMNTSFIKYENWKEALFLSKKVGCNVKQNKRYFNPSLFIQLATRGGSSEKIYGSDKNRVVIKQLVQASGRVTTVANS